MVHRMRGRKLGRNKIEKFLEILGMTGSVLRAAAAAKAARNTFYCLRASDPRFREAWDQALERGPDALEDSLFERGAASDTVAAIFLLKKRRPHIYGDQPKTLNQNLRKRRDRSSSGLRRSVYRSQTGTSPSTCRTTSRKTPRNSEHQWGDSWPIPRLDAALDHY
jgi:hypothetical protein